MSALSLALVATAVREIPEFGARPASESPVELAVHPLFLDSILSDPDAAKLLSYLLDGHLRLLGYRVTTDRDIARSVLRVRTWTETYGFVE